MAERLQQVNSESSGGWWSISTLIMYIPSVVSGGVFQQVNLPQSHSYRCIAAVNDRVTWSQISVQRREAATSNPCSNEELMTDTQRLRHLISEKGRGLSTGACDVTEGAPRKARVTAKFGSCGRAWNGRPERPACNTASALVFSSVVKLKSE